MRLLMIAPQPFFEPRGAPFCVYQHINALLELGYEVDLVTYPLGKEVHLPGLHIYRAPALPFIRAVKPGASLAKFPLDILVFFTALWRLCLRRYRYIHTHEEAALMGIVLGFAFRCKHLYYMHCDLSEIVPQIPLVTHFVKAVQKFMVRNADAVIAFYPAIQATAQKMAPQKSIHMILPPAVDEGLPPANAADVEQLRNNLSLIDHQVVLYTGTLENYQGIDILLESAALVRAACPEVRYVIVGGKPEQVEKFRQLAQKLDVAEIFQFVGQRPLEEMPRYMALADLLLSPRNKGTHTPLKLYTYLRSGKPMVATNILSHTQILTPQMALLVPPTPEGLAQGVVEMLQDKKRAQDFGKYAQQFSDEHYSWSAFLEKNQQVYREFVA